MSDQSKSTESFYAAIIKALLVCFVLTFYLLLMGREGAKSLIGKLFHVTTSWVILSITIRGIEYIQI